MVAAALAYCEQRGDAMFVGTAPPDLDPDGIKTYAAPFRARQGLRRAVRPVDPDREPARHDRDDRGCVVPPVGHVLGVYARIADARGVWKAPAGDERRCELALGVEFDMTDADHTDLVKNGSVNGIRAIPGSGIVIDSSRTLSTDTRWLFVNVRRLFNFVKSLAARRPAVGRAGAARRGAAPTVRFNVVTPFLLGLWTQGAFGTDPPEQVFTVKCDASNNPPADVNQGRFKLEVFFYPVKPAETIIIIVGQQDSGATASELTSPEQRRREWQS